MLRCELRLRCMRGTLNRRGAKEVSRSGHLCVKLGAGQCIFPDREYGVLRDRRRVRSRNPSRPQSPRTEARPTRRRGRGGHLIHCRSRGREADRANRQGAGRRGSARPNSHDCREGHVAMTGAGTARSSALSDAKFAVDAGLGGPFVLRRVRELAAGGGGGLGSTNCNTGRQSSFQPSRNSRSTGRGASRSVCTASPSNMAGRAPIIAPRLTPYLTWGAEA